MSKNKKKDDGGIKAIYQRNKRSRDRHLDEQKPGAKIRNNPDYAEIIKTIREEK